jgi:hypothetical protein
VGKVIRTGSILVIDDERKVTELVEFIDEFGLRRLRTVDGHPVNRINEDTFDILRGTLRAAFVTRSASAEHNSRELTAWRGVERQLAATRPRALPKKSRYEKSASAESLASGARSHRGKRHRKMSVKPHRHALPGGPNDLPFCSDLCIARKVTNCRNRKTQGDSHLFSQNSFQ